MGLMLMVGEVECGKKKEETTEKGVKTWRRCEGKLLPVEATGTDMKWTKWVCSDCGREIK